TYCQLRGNRLPFTGGPAEVTAGHLLYPPDLTMLPDEERPALARALAKTPSERWPTRGAFVEALQACPAGRPAEETAHGPAARPLPEVPGGASWSACLGAGASR